MAQTFTLAEKPAVTDLDGVHASRDFRRLAMDGIPVGVNSPDHLKVAGTSGRGFSVAAGSAHVRGANVADQGYYRQRIASNIASGLDVSANADANPRLDQIVLRIYDDAYDNSGFSEGRIEVVAGNATASASLANRTGAANLGTVPGPRTMLPLADVLVPGGNPATIPATNYRDRRPMGGFTIMPQILSENVMLHPLIPHPATPARQATINGTDHPSKISAALFMLMEEMPTPTKIRWHYVNGDNAGANPITAANNWKIGLYTSDGRCIFTVTDAWSGASGQSTNNPTVTAASSSPLIGGVMPAGLYWVAFAISAIGTAQTAFTYGATNDQGQLRGQVSPGPNMFLRLTTGGPGALLATDLREMGMADSYSVGVGQHLPVPVIVLEP
jgi:hypothetical protein